VVRGHSVTLIGRAPIEEMNLSSDGHVNALVIDFSGDMTTTFERAGRPDALVHLASAGVSPAIATREVLETFNHLYSVSLCEHFAMSGVKHIVSAGTWAEYGRSVDQHCPVQPHVEPMPVTEYAVSKARALVGFEKIAATTNVPLSHVRIFNAYGEGQNQNALWPAIRKAAFSGDDMILSTGTQIRDFVPIQEVTTTLANALDRPPVDGFVRVSNCGTGKGISIRDFATLWWRNWNADGELIFGKMPPRGWDPPCSVADLTTDWIFESGTAELDLPQYC
jgi:nucleoside-diphosphate-sugar epimerase